MTDGFRVDTHALGQDGERWRDWRQSLETGRESVSLDWELGAFSTLPGFSELAEQYSEAAAELRAVLQDGSIFFGAIGDRLDRIIDLYSEAEEQNVAAIQALDV